MDCSSRGWLHSPERTKQNIRAFWTLLSKKEEEWLCSLVHCLIHRCKRYFFTWQATSDIVFSTFCNVVFTFLHTTKFGTQMNKLYVNLYQWLSWNQYKKNIEVQKLSLVHNFVPPADIELIDNFQDPSWNSFVTDFFDGWHLICLNSQDPRYMHSWKITAMRWKDRGLGEGRSAWLLQNA